MAPAPPAHPTDCPGWEYNAHPKRAVLQPRIAAVLRDLRNGLTDLPLTVRDSRRLHGFLFDKLTPDNHPYFAGHYRGEDYRCLKHYVVGIPGDSSVGSPPGLVDLEMRELDAVIRKGLASLDAASSSPTIAAEDKVLNAAVFAARLFECFLRIHPYANGNGHCARLILWALLGRFGYWPTQLTVDPRPPGQDPPIVAYRKGDPSALEKYILHCILSSLAA